MAAPATLPSSKDIERASKFTREPFLAEGEDAATVLAPGTPHRRAFDAAMAEIEAGAKVPSVAWRRTFSLLLGLERLLGQDEPHLADGAVLSAHQVDAQLVHRYLSMSASSSAGDVYSPAFTKAVLPLESTNTVIGKNLAAFSSRAMSSSGSSYEG